MRIPVIGLLGISLCLQAGASDVTRETLGNGSLLHEITAAPVIGQPFSAVQVHRNKRTLADGTNVVHDGHHGVARDAEGRVRVEMRLVEGKNGQPDTIMVYVVDPVAHTLSTWMSGANAPKVASLTRLREADTERPQLAQARPVISDRRPQPIITTEDLGADILQGQMVTIAKITTIVPAGRSGNDAPITKTHEVWTSPELKLILKEQWEDPRTGERTIELDKLSRAAPDPALFHVPPGYQVKSLREGLKELEQKMDAMQ